MAEQARASRPWRLRTNLGVPVFHVRLIANPDDPARFAVLMGLSHAVGDGHTYHKVLRLLFSDDPIESLIVDRITTTYQQQEDFIGPDYRITSSWSFLRVAIWGEMRRALLGYTTAPVFQLIDSN